MSNLKQNKAMKFQIELKEFYIEEGELSQSLHQAVIKSVTERIMKQIESRVEKTIQKKTQDAIIKSMNARVDKIIDEFIINGKIKSDYSSEAPLSVADYIKLKFNNKNGWGNPTDQIEKLAAKLGAEMRSRYDIVFATQIVKAIDKQGLLREDVARLLLDKTPNI